MFVLAMSKVYSLGRGGNELSKWGKSCCGGFLLVNLFGYSVQFCFDLLVGLPWEH